MVLSVFAAIAIGPFLYLLSPSFRQSYELFSYPPTWIPKSFYTGNFGTVLHGTSYLRWALNTLIFATSVTLITLVIDTLAGLRLRAASLSRQDGALRARAGDVDDPDGRGRRPALHLDLAPPRLDAQRGQHLPRHDPADGLPARSASS